jgi:hypothetical protein
MATTLNAGDIAIIGYLAGGTTGKPNNSNFSFITFVDLDSGTDIYFTNNGWTGSGFNGVTESTKNGAENLTKFTANGTIPAGSIIRSDTKDWTTSGLIGGGGNGSYSRLSLATPTEGGDQITALQSTNSSNPLASGFVPLYQIDYTGAFENATNSNTGSLVTGLSNDATGGNTATLKSNTNTFAEFINTGVLSNTNTKAEWLEAVNTDTNWTYSSVADTSNLPTGNVALAPEPITMFGSLTALVIGAGLKQFRKKFQ